MRLRPFKMPIRNMILWLLPILFTLPACPAQGQTRTADVAASSSTPAPIERSRWIPDEGGPEIRLDNLFISGSSLEGDQGGFSVYRLRTSMVYSHFTLGYTRRIYQWSNIDRLPFGDGRQAPWTAMHTLEAKAKYTGSITGPWRYYFSGELSSSFEEAPSPLALDLLWAVGYDYSPRLKVRVGAAMLLHEARTIMTPVAALKWWGGGKNPGASFFSVSVGLPETTLTWHYSPTWSYTLSILADSKVFRLKDDSLVQDKGYAETRDGVVGLMVNYSPRPNLTLSTGAGYAFLRQVKLYNEQGHERGSYDVDGTVVGRFLMAYRF